MKRSVIKLCYRKLIDVNAVKPWDRLVFDDSYTEFRMQVQNFEQVKQYPSYAELLRNVPDAKKLNHMVSASVIGYIQQLKEVMPDILNNLGRRFLKFKNFQFEIINSHLDNKEKHQVSITFYSEPMVWYDTIDNYLLLSDEKQDGDEAFTHLMQLQPYVSIHSIRSID